MNGFKSKLFSVRLFSHDRHNDFIWKNTSTLTYLGCFLVPLPTAIIMVVAAFFVSCVGNRPYATAPSAPCLSDPTHDPSGSILHHVPTDTLPILWAVQTQTEMKTWLVAVALKKTRERMFVSMPSRHTR